MSRVLKIVLSLMVFVLIIIIASFYVIQSKINPEEIKKLAIVEISKALPGAQVSLGTIDYGLGTSVKFYVKDLDLKLKKNKDKLFNVANVEVNIPILSILTGGGTVDVRIHKPNLYYTEISALKTNWSQALPKEQKDKKEAKSNDEVQVEGTNEFELPSFLDNSQININLKEIHVLYAPLNNAKSEIHLSKIALKNLNLKKTTAFEIVSDIEFALAKDSKLNTSLQIIGEADVGKFLKDKVLDTSLLINIQKTKLTGLPIKIPDVETKAKVNVNPQGVITSMVDVKLKNLAEMKAKVNLNSELLKISDLGFSMKLADAKSYLPKDLKGSLKMIDFKQSNLDLSGGVTLDLKSSRLKPNLNVQVKNPIMINPTSDIAIQSTLEGTVKGKNVSLNLVNGLFGGSVALKLNTVFDLHNIPSELSKFSPIDMHLLATNLKFRKSFLQKTIYGDTKGEASKSAQTEKKTMTNPATKILLPKVGLLLEAKNIFIEKQEMNLNAKIDVAGSKISSNNFELKYGKGKLNLPFQVIIQDSQNILATMKMVMSSIKFESLAPVMPPMVSGVSGNFNGKVNGDVKLLSSGVKYDMKVDVNATNGELKDFNVKEITTSMIKGIKDKFPAKYEKLTNRFDRLEVVASVDENINQVKKFLFVGEKKSMEMKLSGTVHMGNKTSKLVGSLEEFNSAPVLKKQTGFSAIPLRITGQGPIVYNVDIGYTLKKLGQGATKAAMNPVKKKVKKQVNKKINNYKKKLEKEAKKKLKNLIKF